MPSSYNTVMKGFTQVDRLTNCFKRLRAMMARGVQPDDITFGIQFDLCIDDTNVSAAIVIISSSSDGRFKLAL